eukprot:scaffold82221_cov96-Cyclotella_meneghiniana.AAC.1
MCKYKKKANDPAIPTKKADLIARYKKTKNNPSPTSSPQNSDGEEEHDEEHDEEDEVNSDGGSSG